MGSFWVKEKDMIFIRNPNENVECLLQVKNAMIEKHEFFWMIKNIEQGDTLVFEKNFMIKDGIKIELYCDFCHNRVTSLTKGCRPCMFQPLRDMGTMDVESLIYSLKEHEFYEVDRTIFRNEIETEKRKHKT